MRRDRWAPALLALLVLVAMSAGSWAAWDVAKPSGTDLISTVDNTIRADKTTLLASLGAEHRFTAADTATYHLPKSARIGVDVDANKALPGLSATPTNDALGRLWYSTDTNAFWYGKADNTWARVYPRPNIAQSTIAWNDGGEPTTTSATWVDITADTFHQVITTTASSAYLTITCTVSAFNDTANEPIYFVFVVDEVLLTMSNNGLGFIDPGETTGKAAGTVTLTRRTTTPLTAGAHTVALQWRVNGGTATISGDVSNTLIVEER